MFQYVFQTVILGILIPYALQDYFERKREKKRKKVELVTKAIRHLSTYDYKSEGIPIICVNLCELLQMKCTRDFDEKVRTKVKKFSENGQVEETDIEELYSLFANEFSHLDSETIEALKSLLQNKSLLPRSVKSVVDVLMGRDNLKLDLITSRKLELIFVTCIEEKNLGNRLTREEIRKVWELEAKITDEDDFKDRSAAHFSSVENTLKKLDGRKKGQREIKNFLKTDSEKTIFSIDSKDAKFVEEILIVLEEEQQKQNLRIRGKGVGKIIDKVVMTENI